MEGFRLLCEKCREETIVNDSSTKGVLNGSKLQIDFGLDEEDPEYSEINLDCLNCGNYIRLS